MARKMIAVYEKRKPAPDIRGLQSALEIIKLSKTLDEARERVEIHIRELQQ